MLKKTLVLKLKGEGTTERKEVKDIQEVLGTLKKYRIDWTTVNKIENSLWETGVAFFNRNFCRIAYYDEVHNVLLLYGVQILRHTITLGPEIVSADDFQQQSGLIVAGNTSPLMI